MKYTLLITLCFFSFFYSEAAVPIQSCGEFEASGEIVKNSNGTGYLFVVNKKSKSQYEFKINIKDELEISSFVSKNVSVKFRQTHRPDGMSGQIDKIISIKKIPIEALEMSKENELKLIDKAECMK